MKLDPKTRQEFEEFWAKNGQDIVWQNWVRLYGDYIVHDGRRPTEERGGGEENPTGVADKPEQGSSDVKADQKSSNDVTTEAKAGTLGINLKGDTTFMPEVEAKTGNDVTDKADTGNDVTDKADTGNVIAKGETGNGVSVRGKTGNDVITKGETGNGVIINVETGSEIITIVETVNDVNASAKADVITGGENRNFHIATMETGSDARYLLGWPAAANRDPANSTWGSLTVNPDTPTWGSLTVNPDTPTWSSGHSWFERKEGTSWGLSPGEAVVSDRASNETNENDQVSML
jgi:hypothetical protein